MGKNTFFQHFSIYLRRMPCRAMSSVLLVPRCGSVRFGSVRFCSVIVQVKHHDWIFGPNFGMVDIQLNATGRPDISRECSTSDGGPLHVYRVFVLPLSQACVRWSPLSEVERWVSEPTAESPL